jgi:hypothetical protein
MNNLRRKPFRILHETLFSLHYIGVSSVYTVYVQYSACTGTFVYRLFATIKFCTIMPPKLFIYSICISLCIIIATYKIRIWIRFRKENSGSLENSGKKGQIQGMMIAITAHRIRYHVRFTVIMGTVAIWPNFRPNISKQAPKNLSLARKNSYIQKIY